MPMKILVIFLNINVMFVTVITLDTYFTLTSLQHNLHFVSQFLIANILTTLTTI